MQIIRFKTSLKCNGCIQKVTPSMNNLKIIDSWRVFLDVQDRILEVEYSDHSEEEVSNLVEEIIKKEGYSIEKI